MVSDPQSPWKALIDSAVVLSKKLKQSKGNRELRRKARTLLKETYSLEQSLKDSSSLTQQELESVRSLERKIDGILKALFKNEEEAFLGALSERYQGPVYDIGQTIQVTYMVMWALHADRLSRLFLARSNWFWERSERAQSGLAGIGKKTSTVEKSENLPRESYELIWRKKRR